MTGLDTTTIAVAAVVGLITFVVGWYRPAYPLALLILGVPFRDFGSRWLNVHTNLTVGQVTAIGRWWFVVIAVLLGVVSLKWFLTHLRSRTWPRFSWLWAAFWASIVAGVVATLVSPNRVAAFVSLRGYLQPVGVLLVAVLIRPTRRQVQGLVIAWLVVGALVAVFGLWQGTAWTEANYRSEGYVRQNGDLVVPPISFRGQTYIRPASTVSGPNELGLDMAVMFFLAAGLIPSFGRRAAVLLGGLALIYTAGLAVTLSRSSLLAYMAGIIVLVFAYRRDLLRLARLDSRRRKIASAVAGIGGLLALGLVFAATGLLGVVVRTVQSLTSQYHYVDTMRALSYLVAHPAGVGMGLVEPKGALVLLSTTPLFHVEGSLFQIGLEMGVWGLALWLAFWAVALVNVFRHMPELNDVWLLALGRAGVAAWVGALVAFLFLPLMQSISLMVWLWALLGLGLQAADIEHAWAALPS